MSIETTSLIVTATVAIAAILVGPLAGWKLADKSHEQAKSVRLRDERLRSYSQLLVATSDVSGAFTTARVMTKVADGSSVDWTPVADAASGFYAARASALILIDKAHRRAFDELTATLMSDLAAETNDPLGPLISLLREMAEVA